MIMAVSARGRVLCVTLFLLLLLLLLLQVWSGD
jgi:hypothetical protein